MGERLIDVRGILASLRPKKVKGIPVGEQVKIVSEDERMLQLVPKMVNSIGGADFVKVYKGGDDLFYTIVKKQ
ncbi:MAG: hypothetical protein GWP03_04760 [Proteobacteria bacterium]|nr:hypothetical protein [Pseudomonadota bacterium]